MPMEQLAQSRPVAWRVVELPQGRELVVRQSRQDDRAALQSLYEGLDAESRYRRFFSVYHPPLGFFDRLVTVDDRGGAGLVACVRNRGSESEDLVGEASFELLANGNGEFEITIAGAWRGWLGPYMLDALLAVAASLGVLNLEADVLSTNSPMLAVLRSRGYVIVPNDDWTILHVAIPSGPGGPQWPACRAGYRLLVEGVGSHAAASVAAVAAGLEVVHCPGPVGRGRRCPVLVGKECFLAKGADAIVLNQPEENADWDMVRECHGRLAHHPPVWVAAPGRRVPLRPNETTLVAGNGELTDFFASLPSAEES